MLDLREPQPNTTPVYLYNPSKDDFTTRWDDKPVTIHSEELVQYPHYLAHHIAKHLAQKIMGDRGVQINPEADLAAIMDEILITV